MAVKKEKENDKLTGHTNFHKAFKRELARWYCNALYLNKFKTGKKQEKHQR